MDTLTHLVMGHVMGVLATGSTGAVQAGAYWGALVGNSLPDIDVPAGHLLGRGWAFHRKFTHTAPGILSLSIAAAGVITLAIPESAFLTNLTWTLAGCVIHVFVDCLNLFGTRPLWPFSDTVVGWGVLFILDPFILLTLSAGSLGQLLHWFDVIVLKTLYASIWIYVFSRWLIQLRLKQVVGGPNVRRAHVVPFFSFWRYFRESGDTLEYGKVRTFTGILTPLEVVTADRGPAVEASQAHPRVVAFLRAARYPFARVEPIETGYRVVWQDLFSRLRGWRHSVEVVLDRDLQLQG